MTAQPIPWLQILSAIVTVSATIFLVVSFRRWERRRKALNAKLEALLVQLADREDK